LSGEPPPGYTQVEEIRSWIHHNLEYKYGVSEATTDAMDTLNHGAGLCRDFWHVDALCRSLQIPARIVVGYLHQLDPMDLHAWFEAFVGGRWYTLTPRRRSPWAAASCWPMAVMLQTWPLSRTTAVRP
jgi:transglutaminase-like putative cysteine protease